MESNKRKIRKLLGDCLLADGFIDKKTLEKALTIQRRKKRLGQIFLELGVVDDVMLAQTLARQMNISFITLDKISILPEVIQLLPIETAQKYQVLPLSATDKRLLIAMADPLDDDAIADLQFLTNMRIDVSVAPRKAIMAAIQHFYDPMLNEEGETREFVANAAPSTMTLSDEMLQHEAVDQQQDSDTHDLLSKTEQVPIIKGTNTILLEAIKRGASDVHIQPEQEATVIRYRIDGIMNEMMRIPKTMHPPVVARIKVISNMDISVRARPQDGRCRLRYNDKKYDFRISSLPTVYGEKVTMRILDSQAAALPVEKLGLSPKNEENVLVSLSRPNGIILVTGPTGSGKSTTLYSFLYRLNTKEVNIITVEDPVEYNMAGINQVQVHNKAGISFATGLRSILRQDPDIVMIGEIRDAETAKTAMRAGQTGHLVLSTLHTNDAPSAVTRLIDMGIEPFVVAGGVNCVLAQRLARRLCPKCREKGTISETALFLLKPLLKGQEKNPSYQRGKGCTACNGHGFKGRLGLHEVLLITSDLREEISKAVPTIVLRDMARKTGFKELIEDGIDKVSQGLTSFEEILRVAQPPELQ
ncbi:MAG: hypothetical protein A2521_07455 [Deltaproteobacteria bacterium RIFOXYD12_FULL_57_12]|nr:MAG: hypothetical protein A2521_07455 [Deltaproteobacteria bacterium RIFOXYD12_FULL_57_12]